ncbi:MAG TPA: hypothetical protein VE870_08195 [Bacteroidales bacterium]|nr:hypothetical protein [Bacteroidales bacterium]
MRPEHSVFSAKILLFGEFTVIFDSKALTIPYSFFNGHISYIGEDKYTRYDMAVLSNNELVSYLDYLNENRSLCDAAAIDLEAFRNDVNEGLYFESNIPKGYGVGSSGALVAALYERYSRNRIMAGEAGALKKLKYIFSLMESYYHGTSSGMDPLNCYIGEPLLFSNNDNIKRVSVPHHENNGDGAIFLINSGYPSTTGPLVEIFMKKTLDAGYKRRIIEEAIPLNDICIDQITGGNMINFFENLGKMSALQLSIFREMIPDGFVSIWNRGLETGEFSLKLCGSGGGGFLLGFTRDYHIAADIMKSEGFEIMPVFKNSSFRTKHSD